MSLPGVIMMSSLHLIMLFKETAVIMVSPWLGC